MKTEFPHLLQGHSLSRRAVLQLAGGMTLGVLARPHGVFAQDALPEFHVSAVEFSFDLPTETPAGWTRVVFDNQGTMDHHVMLLKLHDPATRDELEAALQTPDLGAILALAESVGGVGAGPGTSGSAIIDLEAGEYAAICIVPDDDGTPHYLKGQQALFTVTENDSSDEPPTEELTVDLSEMVFTGIPATVPAGQHIWAVTNIGEQLHELAIMQLAEGISIEQGMQIFGVGEPAEDDAGGEADMSGPPPFTGVPGIAPMSPGHTNYLEVDFEPGSYIAICFIPDAVSGAPHFMLGMITGFTVE